MEFAGTTLEPCHELTATSIIILLSILFHLHLHYNAAAIVWALQVDFSVHVFHWKSNFTSELMAAKGEFQKDGHFRHRSFFFKAANVWMQTKASWRYKLPLYQRDNLGILGIGRSRAVQSSPLFWLVNKTVKQKNQSADGLYGRCPPSVLPELFLSCSFLKFSL